MYDTHITHTTRCVFSMLSSQKHATRRRSAYNQHSYKLQAARMYSCAQIFDGRKLRGEEEEEEEGEEGEEEREGKEKEKKVSA